MKEQAIDLVQNVQAPAEKLNILREYLQAFVMRSLHESEAFACLSFLGGTALRFVYIIFPVFLRTSIFLLKIRRVMILQWLKKLKRDMTLAGFDTVISWNDRKTVHTAWVKVAGLLWETGLAAMTGQNLSIKLEIDSRPPAGAETVSTVINRHMMFALRHHVLSSLMARKVHAVVTRKYSKGRDWYDLLWYLSHRPPTAPNLVLLQSALDQTQGTGTFRSTDWRGLLLDKVHGLDFSKLLEDVEPFLERPLDAKLINAENFQSLLE